MGIASELEWVRACRYLKLRPEDGERLRVRSLMESYHDQDATPDEREDCLYDLIGQRPGRMFEPYCTKDGGVCVVFESAAVSPPVKGRFFQPLELTYRADSKMEGCPDRELPPNYVGGKQPFDVFLLTHIQTDF